MLLPLLCAKGAASHQRLEQAPWACPGPAGTVRARLCLSELCNVNSSKETTLHFCFQAQPSLALSRACRLGGFLWPPCFAAGEQNSLLLTLLGDRPFPPVTDNETALFLPTASSTRPGGGAGAEGRPNQAEPSPAGDRLPLRLLHEQCVLQIRGVWRAFTAYLRGACGSTPTLQEHLEV